MLCPFRIRTIEYESQIGYGSKGDLVAKFKEEQYMECNTGCPYCEFTKPTGKEELIYSETIKGCRRLKK